MSLQSAVDSLGSHRRARRTVAWVGGIFIGIIVALAAFDIVRGYQQAVQNTHRELETQARTIAEQTARSIQAIDVILRHLAEQFYQGTLSSLSANDLRAYLKEQAVGLVQIHGLLIINPDGSLRATSYIEPEREPSVRLSGDALATARTNRQAGLIIGDTIRSTTDARWIFPIMRRLESSSGEFAGAVAARGRIDYFQQFYSDIRIEPGTRVALVHQNTTLIARHPPAESLLGQRVPVLTELLAARAAGQSGMRRMVSPIDGVERFGALELVPDYPLAVVVSRDTWIALAPWRSQSLGTGVRTLALSALAALLLAVLMRQISRLYEARESLEASEQRFALAVAGSNDGIVDWDVVNDRMYSSERAMEILGVQSEVTVRSRAQWRDLVKYHPDDQERLREGLREFLEGRTELRDGEYRVLLPNGEYRWIRHRNKCVRDADGRPLRVAGSVSDIDAQKRAELERLRLEGQLLQAKKLEAIGTLAGGIAHDFNNILAAILGYGEMAQRDAAPGTPLRRHIDAVVNAGMRAKSLVERILAFSRSGIGERKPVHVQSVVTEALDLVAASLPRHVALQRRLAAGDATVLGDPTQIHQVVMNLCANAAQAIKTQGTLTVTLDVIEKSGSIAATSALAGGRYVRLSVRDSGIGIPPHVLERIFDPFFTTKEVGVGTGLGLSLVHGIVTDLGGGIDVESSSGVGTNFTVYLPWSAEASASALADEPLTQGAGETVLLVDDEEALVRLGEEMIASLGYEPVGFTSSTEALAEFRAAPDRFNVVLSDETMPGMTGSELARAIRAIRPDMPVVLMSGFVSPALTARARDLGIADVLSKPVVARDIAAAIASALRAHEDRTTATASRGEA